MSYREEMIKAMQFLAQDDRVVVIGQGVVYPCAVGLLETVECFPASRRIEFPVAEDTQLGVCVGLSLMGYIPLAVFPRMDFLVLAANQLLHLNLIEEMSRSEFQPRVIIRTSIGSKTPLDAGPQHTGDYTEGLRKMLNRVNIIKLEETKQIIPAYQQALNSERSTILIEISEKVRETR